MDRNTDYMAIYRNINASLRKRFRKKINLLEGSEQFASLGKRFLLEDCPSYAALCSLAQARCEHALSNSAGEVQCLLEAGRLFVEAERQSYDLQCSSYQESLSSAINCFEHAIKVSIEVNESSLAACYCQEIATILLSFKKPGEARIYYQRAAELHLQNPLECLSNMRRVAGCKIEEDDLEGALTILTEMQFLAQERGGVQKCSRPLGVYSDVIINCEIMRVLLLMILRPTPQRIRPEHAQTLEKYAWQQSNDAEDTVTDIMDYDLFLLLQSLVMSCQSSDIEELRELEPQLLSKLDKEQSELVNKIVQLYSNK